MDAQAKKNHTAWVTGIPYWDVVKSHQVGSPLYYNSIILLAAIQAYFIKAASRTFW